MRKLVNADGNIQFGLYDEPIGDINFRNYALRTPMGIPVPGFLKKFKFNQFHFFGIIGPDLMAGLAVVDLKLITNGFFYLYDRKNRKLIETKKLGLPNKRVYIQSTPETPESRFVSGDFVINLNRRRIFAKGKDLSLEIDLGLDETLPLRICSRAGYRGWVYTQKTAPIPISGEIRYGDTSFSVSSPAYMGLMDWTGGFMRKYTFWNWASTACVLPDGRTFGLNLSCGVNETSFTENAFWLDGRMHKVSTVNFIFDSKDLYRPWQIVSADGKINLKFHPESERGEKLHAILLASRFTQLMGTFEGALVSDDGEKIMLERCPGWTEDHYAKW